MRLERPVERLDAGEQALLQVDEDEGALPRSGLHERACTRRASRRARARGTTRLADLDATTSVRFGNCSTPSLRRSSFSRRTITASSWPRPRTGTPRVKRCGIEQLEERREAVGVTVVRRGAQEEAVLELAARCRGSTSVIFGVDGVPARAGGRGDVGLVEDEQALVRRARRCAAGAGRGTRGAAGSGAR